MYRLVEMMMMLLIVVFQRLQLPLYSTYHMIDRKVSFQSTVRMTTEFTSTPTQKISREEIRHYRQSCGSKRIFLFVFIYMSEIVARPKPSETRRKRLRADFRDSIILRSTV